MMLRRSPLASFLFILRGTPSIFRYSYLADQPPLLCRAYNSNGSPYFDDRMMPNLLSLFCISAYYFHLFHI